MSTIPNWQGDNGKQQRNRKKPQKIRSLKESTKALIRKLKEEE